MKNKSEKAVQTNVMLEASSNGWLLWRNNVGVAKREDGVPVRYGLANSSRQMNKVIKSSDLIGIRPVIITPDMVGQIIGQFVAIETKHEGWKYSGKDRETAQKNFIDQVIAKGGHAYFCAK